VADDARLLWTWASDPQVRANSFSSDPFPWASHLRWFEAALADPERALYVVERAGTGGRRPIGQIRFDRTADAGDRTALIDVSVAAEHRGAGWGGALIAAGVHRYFADADTATVEARVKPGNRASARSFTEADFDRQSDDGRPFSRYVRTRTREDPDG